MISLVRKFIEGSSSCQSQRKAQYIMPDNDLEVIFSTWNRKIH